MQDLCIYLISKLTSLFNISSNYTINIIIAYHPQYKKKLEITSIKFLIKPQLFQLFYKWIFLLDASSNHHVKYIKSLHDVYKASITLFATYHVHYTKNPKMTKSTHDIFNFWSLPKLLSLLNTFSISIVKFAMYYVH